MKKKYIKPELCDLFAVAEGIACDGGTNASVCGTGIGTGISGLCGLGTSATGDCSTGTEFPPGS